MDKVGTLSRKLDDSDSSDDEEVAPVAEDVTTKQMQELQRNIQKQLVGMVWNQGETSMVKSILDLEKAFEPNCDRATFMTLRGKAAEMLASYKVTMDAAAKEQTLKLKILGKLWRVMYAAVKVHTTPQQVQADAIQMYEMLKRLLDGSISWILTTLLAEVDLNMNDKDIKLLYELLLIAIGDLSSETKGDVAAKLAAAKSILHVIEKRTKDVKTKTAKTLARNKFVPMTASEIETVVEQCAKLQTIDADALNSAEDQNGDNVAGWSLSAVPELVEITDESEGEEQDPGDFAEEPPIDDPSRPYNYYEDSLDDIRPMVDENDINGEILEGDGDSVDEDFQQGINGDDDDESSEDSDRNVVDDSGDDTGEDANANINNDNDSDGPGEIVSSDSSDNNLVTDDEDDNEDSEDSEGNVAANVNRLVNQVANANPHPIQARGQSDSDKEIISSDDDDSPGAELRTTDDDSEPEPPVSKRPRLRQRT